MRWTSVRRSGSKAIRRLRKIAPADDTGIKAGMRADIEKGVGLDALAGLDQPVELHPLENADRHLIADVIVEPDDEIRAEEAAMIEDFLAVARKAHAMAKIDQALACIRLLRRGISGGGT